MKIENEKPSNERTHSKDELRKLGETLENMNNLANDGRGFQHLRYVVADLKAGDISKARTDILNQSDKFTFVPEEIILWIETYIIGT